MKSSQVADFVSTYSVHPKALASIWHDLHTTPLLELRFDDTVQPEHILVVYRWLKSYETEKELRSSYGYGVESSLRSPTVLRAQKMIKMKLPTRLSTFLAFSRVVFLTTTTKMTTTNGMKIPTAMKNNATMRMRAMRSDTAVTGGCGGRGKRWGRGQGRCDGSGGRRRQGHLLGTSDVTRIDAPTAPTAPTPTTTTTNTPTTEGNW